MTALVSEGYLTPHEMRQLEWLGLTSEDHILCCDNPKSHPLDLHQYKLWLYPVSWPMENAIGDHAGGTSSGPHQPPLHATAADFQVGQGHEGNCCYRVKGTDHLSASSHVESAKEAAYKTYPLISPLCVCVCPLLRSSSPRCQCNMCIPIKCSMLKEQTPITQPAPCEGRFHIFLSAFSFLQMYI